MSCFKESSPALPVLSSGYGIECSVNNSVEQQVGQLQTPKCRIMLYANFIVKQKIKTEGAEIIFDSYSSSTDTGAQCSS